jgi:hypothetical protein
MDSLFDDVSRILAQPRPRRATLRLVVGTAASAAVAAMLPGHAFAWAAIPCGNTTCSPDAGQMCCDATLNLCCASGTCFKNTKGVNVCCPSSTKVCGGMCCGVTETCCGGMCCDTISVSQHPASQTCSLNNAAEVCAAVKISTSTATCNPACAAGYNCVAGTCVCDPATCYAAGVAARGPENFWCCNSQTGLCGPVCPNGLCGAPPTLGGLPVCP